MSSAALRARRFISCTHKITGCVGAAVLISVTSASAASSSGWTVMRVLICSENTRVQPARASASSWLVVMRGVVRIVTRAGTGSAWWFAEFAQLTICATPPRPVSPTSAASPTSHAWITRDVSALTELVTQYTMVTR